MAAAADKTKAQLAELLRLEGNRRCIDCNDLSPSWASVTLGTFFCLNCSGQHRALGVHLSFVRSVTMDRWTAEQVKRMQIGGNKNALAFFRTQPDYRDDMGIDEKYKSQFADLWRKKLTAECEGRTWTPPAAASSASPATSASSSSHTPASRASQLKSSSSLRGFGSDSFPSSNSSGSGSSGGVFPPRQPSNSGNSGNSGNNFQLPTKKENEDYFARLGASNSGRSESLPPSQGGKYIGFGSTPEPSQLQRSNNSGFGFDAEDIINDPMSALSRGWNMFSLTAGKALSTLGEAAGNVSETLSDRVIKPTTTAARDPNFASGLGDYVADIGKRVVETSRSGVTAVVASINPSLAPRQPGMGPGSNGSQFQGDAGNFRGFGSSNFDDEDDEDWGRPHTQQRRNQGKSTSEPPSHKSSKNGANGADWDWDTVEANDASDNETSTLRRDTQSASRPNETNGNSGKSGSNSNDDWGAGFENNEEEEEEEYETPGPAPDIKTSVVTSSSNAHRGSLALKNSRNDSSGSLRSFSQSSNSGEASLSASNSPGASEALHARNRKPSRIPSKAAAAGSGSSTPKTASSKWDNDSWGDF
ncbi:ArfGap-domain-containing protein [Ramicandelaber brevisporus]|nr:ArfGap-domain-containing protein [Ramicandelaber brevisporus]